MTYVSFPGLNLEPFHMNRIAFQIGSISVYWYGIIITFGMMIAVLYGLRHAKHERVKSDDLIDFALCLIICGVIGARLYYVIMRFEEAFLVTGGTPWHNFTKTLYNIIAVWDGGLAIYGGIIAGFLGAVVLARLKHIRFAVIADIAGPSVMVGQIIGRWGNFVNVEAYGAETMLPWRMGIHYSVDGVTMLRSTYVHPTFLYESLWNLVGLILITIFYKKKKFHGQMFLFYMSWYGFGRMLIEGLRTDSLYVGTVRISQLVGFVTFVVGVILMVVQLRRAALKKAVKDEYTAVYAAAGTSEEKNKCVAGEDLAENDLIKNEHDEENDDGKTD